MYNHKLNLFIGLSLVLLGILGGLFCYLQNTAAANYQEVVINELLWMGSEKSSADEWIELRNLTDQEIDLSGWQLTSLSSGQEKLMLEIPAGSKIAAQGYFLISNYSDDSAKSVLNVACDLVDTKVSLSNSGLQIKLYTGDFQEGGNLIDVADDGLGQPLAGEYQSGSIFRSMERKEPVGDGSLASSWQTSIGNINLDDGSLVLATPKAENPKINNPPQAEAGADQNVFIGDIVYFDGQDSLDPDGDVLSYHWNFGDGGESIEATPMHSYVNPGDYLVTLTVSDGQLSASDGLTVTAIKPNSLPEITEIRVEPQELVIGKTEEILVTVTVNDEDGQVDIKEVFIDLSKLGGGQSQKLYDNGSYGDIIANDSVFSYLYILSSTLEVGEQEIKAKSLDQDGALAEESLVVTVVAPAPIAYSDKIIINELFPNPEGVDEGEFIELKNLDEQTVDLAGWQVSDATEYKYAVKAEDFTKTLLAPGEFLVLTKAITGLSLNNSGQETVELFQPDGNLLNSIIYTGPAPEGQSYARQETDKWDWTIQPTPGAENVFLKENQIPQTVINCPLEARVTERVIFDASDSFDPDGDDLVYTWDFGDGNDSLGIHVKHSYQTVGEYQVTLTVTDTWGGAGKATKKIAIKEMPVKTVESPGKIKQPEIVTPEGNQDYSRLVRLNEFLPNPKGLDDFEWIELYNPDQKDIELGGWQLDDKDGGSQPYTFPKDTVIKAQDYLVIKREESKIALNNNQDEVRLLNPKGEVTSQASYEDSPEAQSYAFTGQEWQWTEELTPGEANIFSQQEITQEVETTNKEEQEESETVNNADQQNKVQNSNQSKDVKAGKQALEVKISEIYNLDLGTLVKVSGRVIVEPGVLGKLLFYLVSDRGVQIFQYQGDFPKLALGDLVEVAGEISENQGERRIKAKVKEDIKVLESGEIVIPNPVKIDGINEQLLGQLIIVEDQLIDKSGRKLVLASAEKELLVDCKTSTKIELSELTPGKTVKITGILIKTEEGFKLLPRYQSDIGQAEIPGTIISETEEVPINNQKSNQITKYLIITLAFFSLILSYYGIKNKQRIKEFFSKLIAKKRKSSANT